jgi:hypothetical protein
MARLYMLCSLLLCWVFSPKLHAQNTSGCQPAAPGDSCSAAPLLCGNYLEGYCASNADASPDSSFNTNGAPCFSIENNVWLRIPPCSADVKLEITPVNCSTWNGLEAALFSGGCDSLSLVGNCQALPPNQADTLTFNGLASNEVYWLMIDGTQGDQCQFSIHVVEGIGTGVVTSVSCNCTPGSISGPTSLCPGDVANYTVTSPDCSLSIGTVTGGNGMICSPPADACGAQHDSTAVIWHIPDVMYFIGDSTGLSVQVGVDSNLIGIDTLQMDSIWVEFQTFVLSDSTQADSLAFCDCLTAACSSIVAPLHINIQHHIIQDFGISLTCNMPTVVINNQVVSTPGTYIVSQNHCETHLVAVQTDFNTPFFTTNVVDNHDGTYTVIVNYFGPFYDVLGLPGTPGFNSFTSFPINCGASYSFIVINLQNGCLETSSGTYNCFCNPPMTVTLQKTGDLNCCMLSVPVEAITFPPSAGFYYNWQGPGMSGMTGKVVSASQPGEYAVTVTNLDGCTATGTIAVLADFQTPPASISPNQSICAGQTAALNAGSTIPSAIFNWNNGNTGPNISISPSITTPYTVTVTNPDNCCANTMSATVNVNNQPQISTLLETCNPSGTAYVVSFQMTGQAPFLVNDVPVTGNNFNSSPVSSGDSYAFIVKSAPSGCETTQTGQHNCDFACVAAAGQMDPTTLHVCVEASAQGHYLGGAQFGPHDIAQFVLHDLSGTNLGLMIAKNETGVFGFLPGQIQTEKTYYISQIVGKSDGSGNIDLNDPCLSVAAGQPIVFHAAPEALVSGNTTVCPEQSFSLSGSGATDGFWILPGNQIFNGNALNLISAEVDHLFDYQYVARNIYNCADTAHVELSVWATLEKPDYAVQNPPCADLTPILGAVQISSPAAGLQFSLDAAAYLQTDRFEQLSPGLHTLRAQDANGCTRLDSIYIQAPNPLLLDLGPDLTAHPGEQVQLKGISNAIPVDIQWVASDGQTFSGDLQWAAQFSANSLVSLNITDQNGCTTKDELWINIKADEHFYIPNALAPESAEANRHFTVFCADGYVKNIAALRIFDRWGNMVFERNGFQPNVPNMGWDGSTGGKYALPGAYVYVVELDLFDGTRKTINGSLTVVR